MRKSKAKTAPPESPLVPNKTLKRMYIAMVEARLLDRDKDLRGQEACRVSALLDLGPEDLSSDLTASSAYLRGWELSRQGGKVPPCVLPPVERGRLQLALGAAFALKNAAPGKVAVVLAGRHEAKPSLWTSVFSFAAEWELPVIFVVPPEGGTAKFDLSARATALGVPGIPVDAGDAIALYRVAQESIGRARAGGGPALMEGIAFIPPGSKAKQPPDPITALGRTLVARSLCDQAWLDHVAASFRARLKTL